MKVLSLTGGIGMGKSTAAASFRRLHVPVFDADATVHRLQAPGGRAVAPIAAVFPGTVRGDRIDREALRHAVLGKPDALRRLERIIHPLVRDAEWRFLAAARRRASRLVVLDIPLFFETRRRAPNRNARGRFRWPHGGKRGGAGRCDAVLVVTAPAAVQRARVLRRPGMTPERLRAILARQMPDAEKRRRADHVVPTGLSRHHADRAIRALTRRLRAA